MASFDRILASYEQGLKKLADDLIAQNNPSEEERANLTMLTHMLQAVVTTYQTHQLDRAAALQATKPISAGAAIQTPVYRFVAPLMKSATAAG